MVQEIEILSVPVALVAFDFFNTLFTFAFVILLKLKSAVPTVTYFNGSTSVVEMFSAKFGTMVAKYLLNSLAMFLSPVTTSLFTEIALRVVVLDFLFNNSLIVFSCQHYF